MIVMTMAITASVNASSRPFVTARASHTKSPATETGCDQNDLVPVPQIARLAVCPAHASGRSTDSQSSGGLYQSS